MNTDDDVDAGEIDTDEAHDFGTIADPMDYFATDFGDLE